MFALTDVGVLFLRQDLSAAAPSQGRSLSCNISVSDPVSGLDSISLTVFTPGRDCLFTLTSADAGGDSGECRRRGGGGDEEIETNEIGGRGRGEDVEVEVETVETAANYLGTNQLGVEDEGIKEAGEVFTCVLEHLEPGTAYQLQVQSRSGEEATNITLHTSKSSSSPHIHISRVVPELSALSHGLHLYPFFLPSMHLCVYIFNSVKFIPTELTAATVGSVYNCSLTNVGIQLS